MEILKIPVQLCKRMADGGCSEMRYMIEVPEQYIKQGIQLDLHKDFIEVVEE